MKKPSIRENADISLPGAYNGLVDDIGKLLESARRTSARVLNSLMTATYWEIGRWIVEFEQSGADRAEYGDSLLLRLSEDLGARHGRGFSPDNLESMRRFYRAFSPAPISETVSRKSHSTPPTSSISETLSRKLATPSIQSPQSAFPLPWSHYVLLSRNSRSPEALDFYHTEALRGGWTVRQLKRQIDSQFYERTALSRDKVAMLEKGGKSQSGDKLTADEEIKDPLVLEFLGLKDEYSESELEEALILHLEHFLLELGNDFAFVGRQRRMRIDDEWFRVDLLFYHRRLHCLVIIDLKLGKFTHADAGQMHLYLNYAAEHWTQPGENPPVGMILCSGKGNSLVRYSTENLPNKILVRDYLTALPDERTLADEIASARKKLEARSP